MVWDNQSARIQDKIVGDQMNIAGDQMDIAGDQMDIAWDDINFAGVQMYKFVKLPVKQLAGDQRMSIVDDQRIQIAGSQRMNFARIQRIPLRAFARVQEEIDGKFSKNLLMTWSSMPS